MGSVIKLAEAFKMGLKQAHPKLRKSLLNKIPLAVASILEARTANTMMIASFLPLESERLDMRAQWLTRLLGNSFLESSCILEPWARQLITQASSKGQTVILSMDQTESSDDFAILMVSLRVGDRSLPLVWHVEMGSANIGFTYQKLLLEAVMRWLPQGACVLLSGDRFYPSEPLFLWLIQAQWNYRLRLKGNLSVDTGQCNAKTTGDLAQGVKVGFFPNCRLFESAIPTNIGILHEAGHPEPWVIAMNCHPTKAAILDYGLRWQIEPMFSDFKSRGFGLTDSQLKRADRIDHLVLLMTLAMYWCVITGQNDAQQNPTPLEKKA